jgi:hypothetical protein
MIQAKHFCSGFKNKYVMMIDLKMDPIGNKLKGFHGLSLVDSNIFIS